MAKYISKFINDEELYYLKDSEARSNLIDKSEKGAANGVATLDSVGKVPSSQLPSYVDDVIEGYYYDGKFYTTYVPGEEGQEGTYSGEITPESGKIYVDIPTNQSYRWSGSNYIVINSPYVLPIASNTMLGGIKVGDGLSIDNNGTLSAEAQEVEIGTDTPVDPNIKLFVDESSSTTYDVYTQVQIDTMMANKVNVEVGKGLSTNDYDNASKNKLDGLPTNSELTVSLNRKANSSTTLDGYGITNAYTKTEVDALTRHTRKTDFDLTTLKLAVADQNLEKYGLKVGDQKTINGHTYVIAGLNCMKGSNSYTATVNHVGLIVIPHTTHAWNESGNTYTGADSRGAGYLNSDLHYYLKNTVLPLAQTDLGTSNLITHNKLLSSAVNTTGYNRSGSASGCSSSWTWSNEYISALSEMQVYGGTIWSSSAHDTGEADQQLEVFKQYKHTDIFGGEYIWLRDVASATDAAYAYNYGNAYYNTASYAYYVAGLILFH